MFSQKLDSGGFYEVYAENLRGALSRRDIEGFAGKLSELMEKSVEGTKTLLLELGFQKKQLIWT